jgi:hypothetical protein
MASHHEAKEDTSDAIEEIARLLIEQAEANIPPAELGRS